MNTKYGVFKNPAGEKCVVFENLTFIVITANIIYL